MTLIFPLLFFCSDNMKPYVVIGRLAHLLYVREVFVQVSV